MTCWFYAVHITAGIEIHKEIVFAFMWSLVVQWNLDIINGQGTGNICFL